uniref:Uncharacterized protein n=1 Tax=Ditylenchus dipsaci TaxID=166011 RepID=A0A915DYS9_9BILA
MHAYLRYGQVKKKNNMNSVIFSYDLYAQGMPPMSQANSITLFSSERKRVNPRGWCSVKTGIRVFRIQDGFRGVVIPQQDFSTQSFMFPTEQTFDSGVHGVSIGHEVQTSYNANVQDDQIVHVSGAGVSLVN